jgi:type I restriction-modification system DNA methylase subunit
MRLRKFGLVLLLVSPLATAARPQQDSASGQQESLADAARRAQEQKKNQPQAAKVKVWDNDNIPATNNNISVVGQAGPTEAGPAPPTPPGSAQKALTPEQKTALVADLSAGKAQLESLKTDLDIAQRKYALDEQTYLSNPNYTDKTGAQALDDEKQQIAAKQQEIAEAQKKVDDLQAQVDAANAGASK